MEVYKLNLSFTKVTSPIDGQVSRYFLTLGNLVVQDQTLLTTVVSLDPMYVYFDMDEGTLLRARRAINEGKILRYESGKIPVRMGLQGEAGFPHTGFVNFVNNQVNPNTGSISVRGEFANPKPVGGIRVLSAGMFVRVRLPIGQPYPALLVIDRAIGSDQDRKYVYVVDSKNTVQQRSVTTGALQADGRRVVSAGLTPNDRVVVGSLQQVRPKMEVKTQDMPMPTFSQAEDVASPTAVGSGPKSMPGGAGQVTRSPRAMLSHFFIDRPIFASVVSIVITLTGAIALVWLPIAQYPQITPPAIQVQIVYPGASAQVVADTVAAPIEQQVNGVEGMLYMSSQMGNDGSYSLSVTFDVGTNLNTALVMVQNRVTLAMPQLPTPVQNQGITIRKRTPDILLVVNFYSKDGRYDDLYLSNYATINVCDELLRVDGVSDVHLFGQRDYSIRVWLDPQKMAAYGINAGDVASAIGRENIDLPAGRIGQPPAMREQAFDVPIDGLGRLSEPEQFADIIVKVDRGQPVQTAAAAAAAPVQAPSGLPQPGAGNPQGGAATGTVSLPTALGSLRASASLAAANATTAGATGGGVSGGGSTGGGANTGGGGMSGGGATAAGGATTGSSLSASAAAAGSCVRHDDRQRHRQ